MRILEKMRTEGYLDSCEDEGRHSIRQETGRCVILNHTYFARPSYYGKYTTFSESGGFPDEK